MSIIYSKDQYETEISKEDFKFNIESKIIRVITYTPILLLYLFTKIPQYILMPAVFLFILYDYYPTIQNIKDKGELPIKKPSIKQLSLIIISLVLIYTIYYLIALLQLPTGEGSTHSILNNINIYKSIVYLILFWLIVAPLEEILIRHILQKIVLSRYKTYLRITIASITFSLLHTFSYGLDPGIIQTLVTIFLVSILLGASYEYSNNLTVPIIIHAIMNSIALIIYIF
jgi:membrane protease YdiL (CAAX protease family)